MSHYFLNDNDLETREVLKTEEIVSLSIDFYTDKGVFSKDSIDYATRFLLEVIVIDKEKTVLDLGCGYGVIGIYLGKMFGSLMTMADVNERSLGLASKNIKLNSVLADLVLSDGFSNINSKFDYIVTNPPIRVGKKKMYELLNDSMEHLNDNGELWLVIHKKHGALSLISDFSVNYDVIIAERKKGIYVIKMINK